MTKKSKKGLSMGPYSATRRKAMEMAAAATTPITVSVSLRPSR